MGCAWNRNRWRRGISRNVSDYVNVDSGPICNDFGSLKEGNMVALYVGIQDRSIVCVGAQVVHSRENHDVGEVKGIG
jgi:hypothetical protein